MFVADLGEQSANEAQERGFIGKEGGDADSAFDFLIDAFEGVAGAHAAMVGGRKGEDGESLRATLTPRMEHLPSEPMAMRTAQVLIWEELTEWPQSSSTILVAFRVDTPWIDISARASMRACSLRMPFFESAGIEFHAIADLRDAEFDGAYAGGEGLLA